MAAVAVPCGLLYFVFVVFLYSAADTQQAASYFASL